MLATNLEVKLPQAIWGTRDLLGLLLKQIIWMRLYSKAIHFRQPLNCFKRIHSPSFLPERHQSQASPLFSILILTKTVAPIIREVIHPKGKALVALPATKRSLREKIAAQNMMEPQTLNTRRLIIIIVTSLKAHGKIKTLRIKVFLWGKLMIT